MGPANTAPKTRRRRFRRITAALIIVILLLAATCTRLFIGYRQALQKQSATPAGRAAKLTVDLQDIIALPKEQPTLATVLDKTKLGNPQLIAEARNGDELLVYAKSRRIILYRPSSHKVVDMFHVEAPKN